ncbi:conserved hypothetical protein [Beutenbergia cavernae DSM 12333]|uniref:DUF2752 domain-containing protein n=1 Tax=Beutenbergia cavernae (strain ATCC BAA-8 / DSM 12333 / CCUG 43141 / JCM 11478 / NBRC 16432 / NCIMB 13614 / HKI 0122) TaxID=471853 RepID=C5BV86_BEUC1|nr:DUF2752 domain-containing protein [Beutenbergia cavernae]ACQ80473.1 conserved hypothetical protein [Beutenbergia cavernae DSM 12333]
MTTAPVLSSGATSTPEPRPRWRGVLGTGAVVAAATLLVALHDPHQPGSYLSCPFLTLTGFACPGCGGLRAVHDLVHLDLAAAWAMNPLVVVFVPITIALWLVWLWRVARRRAAWQPGPRTIVGLAVLVVTFWVLRNVPVLASYLGPAAVG